MILAVIQQAYCRNVLPTTKENFLEANDYLNFICYNGNYMQKAY